MTARLPRNLALVLGVAGIVLASPLSATVYVNKVLCGGDTFTTCSAVYLDVTGTVVTFRVFNLSGNSLTGIPSYSGTVFNGFGFYNVPASIDANVGSLVTVGPARPGNVPGQWVVKNNAQLAFIGLNFTTNSTPTHSVQSNGISSACPPSANLPPLTTQLYQNPCGNPNTLPFSNWVTFTFTVTGPWDATGVGLVLRGKTYFSQPSNYGGTTNAVECWDSAAPAYNIPSPNCTTATITAGSVPEPMTMTLLATGLVGLGGLGYLRRRRRAAQ